MKILLTTLNAKFVHSSLALRYLRAMVKNEFPGVRLLEFTINDRTAHIVADIFRTGADLVCFSCYIWNISETMQVVRLLRKVRPTVRIVVGGPEVSYETDAFLHENPWVDVVVVGEGEVTFLELLRAFRDGTPLESVDGIVYRESGTIRQTPPRRPMDDLSGIPSPYAEDLDELKNRIVYFECSRGCPFHCQFCLSSIVDGVRYFPIDTVKRDLKRLIDFGARQIKFVDRTFNLHKSYALEIFRFLVENHGNTTFHFEITADLLRDDVIDDLVTVPPGLFQFEIGVQSTNEETNRLVRRNQNFARLSRNIQRIRQAGNIHLHLDLIAGLPGEDYRSFRKTFNDVFALGADEIQLGFLKMLKGTGLKIRARDHEYVYSDQPPYEILSSKDLSYDEILRLKQIEDLLEKYANAHRVEHTLPVLVHHCFESAFDFFEAFAAFWEKNGWFRVGHRQKTLYDHLMRFLMDTGVENWELLGDLVKFDFALHERSRKWPLGVPEDFDPGAVEIAWKWLQDPSFRANYIPELKTLDPYTMRRNLQLLSLRYNPFLAKQCPDVWQEENPSLVAVYYGTPDRQPAKAKAFDLTGLYREWHRLSTG